MNSVLKTIAGPMLILGVIGILWMMREQLFRHNDTTQATAANRHANFAEKQTVLEISSQARKNLRLVSKAVQPQTYWRTVVIPGEIADWPGLTDRGVTSPAEGVVTAIHAFQGDTMRPGEPMFTLRLFSEYLQTTQTQLFKARQETAIVQAEINRLSDAVSTGAISGSKVIELQSEIKRQATLMQAARQELLVRGLTPDQVQQIESGSFVSTVEIVAPPVRNLEAFSSRSASQGVQQISFVNKLSDDQSVAYEVQELAVELGQQVQTGQLLAKLSNHQMLYVVGHAFKRDAAILEQAAQVKLPIEVEFAEDDGDRWPPLNQSFKIRHLSNTIDKNNRTFDFFVPLTNQSRAFDEQGHVFLVWRFRPGQRARISVPVEKFDDVFVLPAEAVVREGPEAFVFRQNGDLFKQIPVQILNEDRRFIVIANDGSITAGAFLAQSSAASLNRVLKSQSVSGQQPGMHVHADGTTHAAH